MSRRLIGLTVCATVAGTLAAAPGASSASDTAPAGTVSTTPTADSYIEAEAPHRNVGSAVKLVASSAATHKTTLLKFTVPVVPTGARVASAKLTLDVRRLERISSISVAALASNNWSEAAVTYANAPRAGSVLSTAPVPVGASSVTVQVPVGVVTPGGTVSLAVATPAGAGAFSSRETGADAPVLRVDWTKPLVPTAFGANIWPKTGESYADAFARAEATYGPLEVVRVFFSGLPAPWPGRAALGSGAINVSFKALPTDILAGKHDAALKGWFATAPRDRDVYWTFYHEPEDNIARGEFTAADFRAAFRRLDQLADAAGNPRLKATPVLMHWSLEPASGRNWRDYYPGSDVADVLGWDVYNLSAKSGGHDSPARMFDKLVATSASVGKPYAVSEFGSLLVTGDDGTRRAQWLRDSVTYLRANNAVFVAYFDAIVPSNGADFRLHDAPSQAAWRWAVSGS